MDLLSFFFFFFFLFQHLSKISWTQRTMAFDFLEAMDDEYFFTSDWVSSHVRVLGNEEHQQPLESLFLVSQTIYANGRNKRIQFPQHASIPLTEWAVFLYFTLQSLQTPSSISAITRPLHYSLMKENPACSWNETEFLGKINTPLDAFLCIWLHNSTLCF